MVFPMAWAEAATTTLTNKFKDIAFTKELESMPPRERIDKVIHTVANLG